MTTRPFIPDFNSDGSVIGSEFGVDATLTKIFNANITRKILIEGADICSARVCLNQIVKEINDADIKYDGAGGSNSNRTARTFLEVCGLPIMDTGASGWARGFYMSPLDIPSSR